MAGAAACGEGRGGGGIFGRLRRIRKDDGDGCLGRVAGGGED